METTDAFTGLVCLDCGERVTQKALGPCPACEGVLDPTYDYETIDVTRADVTAWQGQSMWRYDELLPFPASAAVSLGEGNTPLIDCPSMAADLGVDRVLIKDEGQNPTSTFKDRGHSPAVTAAAGHNATEIALASAGNAGHAAATYASRANLSANVFLPSRAGPTQRTMVRVHGADLTIVDGTLDDAGAAYEVAFAAHEDWYSTQSFVTPYRHEGKKTMGYEIIEALDWTVPDTIVYPTGGGVGLYGIHKGIREFRKLGLIDGAPALYAAQSTGCAPIVRAWDTGADRHTPWADPDTVCTGLEVADPGASPHILRAIRETGGGAVATDDDAILAAARRVARRDGVEMVPTAAAAASGARKLARAGEFADTDTVVILNTGAGSKDAGLLATELNSEAPDSV